MSEIKYVLVPLHGSIPTGVFDDRETAEMYRHILWPYHPAMGPIEIMEVPYNPQDAVRDAVEKYQSGLRHYTIRIGAAGEIVDLQRSPPDASGETWAHGWSHPDHTERKKVRCLSFPCWATSDVDAVRQADERRRELIAADAWDVEEMLVSEDETAMMRGVRESEIL